jgi:hypothetical protein
MDCLSFNHIVGIATIVGMFATIIGLIFIIFQIRSNKNDACISRTLDLITRYYSNYDELKTSSTNTDYSQIDPFKMETPTERAKYQKNWKKQLNFFLELALYWDRGLIDKKILRYHLKDKIKESYKSLQGIYKDELLTIPGFTKLKEMIYDMENMDLSDYSTQKLYNKMNITQ